MNPDSKLLANEKRSKKLKMLFDLGKIDPKRGLVPWSKGLTVKTSEKLRLSVEKRRGLTPWNKGKKTGLVPRSAFRKGFTPWNKNKKGTQVAWNKGLTSRTCSSIHSGKNHPMYGKHLSEEAREKIGNAHRREKCFFWRGGTGDYYFRGNDWESIRLKVWKRDSFKCQNCGRVNCKVFAHHIVPFAISNDNSLENLVTLCGRCHMTEEYVLKRKYFGKNKVAWDSISKLSSNLEHIESH